MAKFLVPFFEDACFNPGGDHGLAMSQYIEGLVGVPGLVAFLALTAVAFLAYVSMETIIFIRKLFNPLRYLKKIPMEIHIGKGDAEGSPESSNIVEDPDVFDDPEAQTVEFTDLDTTTPTEEPAVPEFTEPEESVDTEEVPAADDTDDPNDMVTSRRPTTPSAIWRTTTIPPSTCWPNTRVTASPISI